MQVLKSHDHHMDQHKQLYLTAQNVTYKILELLKRPPPQQLQTLDWKLLKKLSRNFKTQTYGFVVFFNQSLYLVSCANKFIVNIKVIGPTCSKQIPPKYTQHLLTQEALTFHEQMCFVYWFYFAPDQILLFDKDIILHAYNNWPLLLTNYLFVTNPSATFFSRIFYDDHKRMYCVENNHYATYGVWELYMLNNICLQFRLPFSRLSISELIMSIKNTIFLHYLVHPWLVESVFEQFEDWKLGVLHTSNHGLCKNWRFGVLSKNSNYISLKLQMPVCLRIYYELIVAFCGFEAPNLAKKLERDGKITNGYAGPVPMYLLQN